MYFKQYIYPALSAHFPSDSFPAPKSLHPLNRSSRDCCRQDSTHDNVIQDLPLLLFPKLATRTRRLEQSKQQTSYVPRGRPWVWQEGLHRLDFLSRRTELLDVGGMTGKIKKVCGLDGLTYLKRN